MTYDAKRQAILITLRDLTNGEREWIVEPAPGASVFKWKGFLILEDVFVIDAGGFEATIEHLRDKQVTLPPGVLAFYDKLKAEAAASH